MVHWSKRLLPPPPQQKVSRHISSFSEFGSKKIASVRELSFLMLGIGVEEFLEEYQIFCLVILGCQIILPFHGVVAKISAKKVLILKL